MKYAVIYQSMTGNTQKLAEHLYQALPGTDKNIFALDELAGLPEAEVYLVGFGVKNTSCSLDIINLLEKVERGNLLLFATCGCPPTEQYRQEILRKLEVWLPENVDFLGLILCQGCVSDLQQELWIEKMPQLEDQLEEMFIQGDSHPDDADFRQAEKIMQRLLL